MKIKYVWISAKSLDFKKFLSSQIMHEEFEYDLVSCRSFINGTVEEYK